MASRPDNELQQIIDQANYNGPGLNFFDPKTRDPWLIVRTQNAKAQAAEAQRVLDQRAQQRADLERIAAERTAAAAQQQAEMQRLQQAQAQAAIDQERSVAELRAQEVQQQQTLAQSRLATQAAAASMRVLQSSGSAQAPTAQMGGRGRTVAQPRSTRQSQSLRIGGTASGPGVGMNIGG